MTSLLRPLAFALSLCLSLVVPFVAAAAESAGLVAVLPVDARLAHVDDETRLAFDEAVRTVSGNALSPRGYTVLTGETTLAVLRDNGIDATKACEASCALEAARELHAKLFVSGVVTKSEGQFVAYVRLFEIEAGRQLSSVQLEGPTMRELRQQLGEKAELLFAPIGAGGPVAAKTPEKPVIGVIGGIGAGPSTIHLQLAPDAVAQLAGQRVEAEVIVDGHATRCAAPLTGEAACVFTEVPAGLVAWRLLVEGEASAEGTWVVPPGKRVEYKLEPGYSSAPCFGAGAVGLAMIAGGFALGSLEGGLGKESAGPVLLVAFGFPVAILGGSIGAAVVAMPDFNAVELSPHDLRTRASAPVSLRR